MKEIKVSPAAEDSLTDILEYSIEQRGVARAEDYKKQLLERVQSVARAELPHPRPCEVLMRGVRDAAGLCYCRTGSHYIILRVTATRVEVVDFIHEIRDLDRLIDALSRKRVTKGSSR